MYKFPSSSYCFFCMCICDFIFWLKYNLNKAKPKFLYGFISFDKIHLVLWLQSTQKSVLLSHTQKNNSFGSLCRHFSPQTVATIDLFSVTTVLLCEMFNKWNNSLVDFWAWHLSLSKMYLSLKHPVHVLFHFVFEYYSHIIWISQSWKKCTFYHFFVIITKYLHVGFFFNFWKFEYSWCAMLH